MFLSFFAWAQNVDSALLIHADTPQHQFIPDSFFAFKTNRLTFWEHFFRLTQQDCYGSFLYGKLLQGAVCLILGCYKQLACVIYVTGTSGFLESLFLKNYKQPFFPIWLVYETE